MNVNGIGRPDEINPRPMGPGAAKKAPETEKGAFKKTVDDAVAKTKVPEAAKKAPEAEKAQPEKKGDKAELQALNAFFVKHPGWERIRPKTEKLIALGDDAGTAVAKALEDERNPGAARL